MKNYIKYTKTSSFLFPLLGIPKSLFNCHITNNYNKIIMTNRFLNAYLQDNHIDNIYNEGPYVFIVVKPYQDVEFNKFKDTILDYDNYTDEYEKEGFLILIYKILDIYLEDYNKILKGKYSLISNEAKKIILGNSYHKTPNAVAQILTKSKKLKTDWETRLSETGIIKGKYVGMSSIVDLKDQEVWGIIELEKETLNSSILQLLKFKKLRNLKPSNEF